MGLKAKLRQWIKDAVTVWHAAGGRRPFTRRSMSEAELLEEYRRSQGGAEAAPDKPDHARKGKKPRSG
jgi:hypothetical protein